MSWKIITKNLVQSQNVKLESLKDDECHYANSNNDALHLCVDSDPFFGENDNFDKRTNSLKNKSESLQRISSHSLMNLLIVPNDAKRKGSLKCFWDGATIVF